jgi:hypothetical protein
MESRRFGRGLEKNYKYLSFQTSAPLLDKPCLWQAGGGFLFTSKEPSF